MAKYKIKLHPQGNEIEVNKNTPFIDVLHEFGVEFPCAGKGTCGNCKVKVLEGDVKLTERHKQKIEELGMGENWYLGCMSKCTSDLVVEVEQFEHIILADESEFEFEQKDGYGIAVDIGTTTIVAQLIDLSSAQVLSVETMLNPQVKFGADLISRIQAVIDGHAGEMTKIIRETLGQMIDKLLGGRDIELEELVIVGNTAMQLIFSDLDVTPLSNYPFHVDDLGLKSFTPEELGWNIVVRDKIRFHESIGSFVGSDILAGIAATKLHRKEKYTALIDLGTNGEIVVGNKDRIVCASTAAGPAFEGANISMGMRAVTGAISSIEIDDDKIKATVIGKTKPKGICGSALIDAIAVLRKLDLIGMFGEIISGEDAIKLAGKVSLSQKDIQEFLLAKAAIAAGLEILASNLSIGVGEIEEVYIAGGFGNYINLENVFQTGMIELPGERIHKMGNTALIGAKMLLFKNGEFTKSILEKTTHVNLEGDPNFQDIYVNKMMLL